MEITEDQIKKNLLIHLASQFVGLKESKNNTGFFIEKFQKAVDGKAHGEPWCASFMQYLIQYTDKTYDEIMQASSEYRSTVHRSEHCLTIWNKTPKENRIYRPEPGCLIIWAHVRNGKETGAGHIGLVTDILSDSIVKTIEGNTSNPSDKVVREGEGVYSKTRDWHYKYGSMLFKGFLRVWQ